MIICTVLLHPHTHNTICSYGMTAIIINLPLQPNGVEKDLGLGELSEYEQKRLDSEVLPELKANIKKAMEFCEKELGPKNHTQEE